jgi:hypothetical protein
MAETIRSYWDLVEPVFKLIDFKDEESFFSTTAVMPHFLRMIGQWHTPKGLIKSSLRACCFRQTDFGLRLYSD